MLAIACKVTTLLIESISMKNGSDGNLKFKMGPVMQKVLLLIEGGILLGLSGRPDVYFKILKKISKEWRGINERTLRKAIRKLYQSQLIDYKENNDGTVSLVLTDGGKKKHLQYNPDAIKIPKPSRWDYLWRLVIFDIPEEKKKERDALVVKLKGLGFYSVQKSVFIHPYECKNEVDFVVELFDLRPYVRFFIVKETDIELDLKDRFGL